MDENIKQLEYIRSQLAWIKSKVELDNQLGLYDINKLGEDIFMHILNDVYDLNLKNANDILHDDFPSIDLVDELGKQVIQVTSTKTLKKARGTVEKLKDLKFHEITDKTSNSLKNSISFFRNLKDCKEYKLSILYIHEKPTITKDWKTFLVKEKKEFSEYPIIGIDDIINIVQSNPSKCNTLYKTIQQRLDSIAFKFNIDSYFEQAEPHLINIHSSKFEQYKPQFINFIESEKKILEVYAVGGNGKSHLLRYFGNIETEYIPLIFTKIINIEEDLKKLKENKNNKKYLFIFDDIDRFLDQPILFNLLSYTLHNLNIKLILSYRTASKEAINTIYRRYTQIESQELEIIWEQNEIEFLVQSLLPNIAKKEATKLAYTFNNNPYLITQAIQGDIKSIQEFSKKIVDDTKVALSDFDLSDRDIKDLLFNLSLLTPMSKNNISEDYQNIVTKLIDKKILRELASKYRFNPDMIGDLYLANYVDENQDNFEKIVENNLKNFSDTVFTNLSYALVYNKSDSLQSFVKKIIQKWIDNQEFSSEHLYLIDKIVYFAPMESFIYLEKATKKLTPKQTNALYDSKMQLTDEDISLSIIEPIISKIIYAFKNNIPTEGLQIEHIINYLTSEKVMTLPKPKYDNQTFDSIFEKLISPLDTKNFDVIFKTLDLMMKWLDEKPLHHKKIQFLLNSVKFLLQATFSKTSYDGISFSLNNQNLNTQHPKVSKLIIHAKNMLLKLLTHKNKEIVVKTIDIVIRIGNGILRNDLTGNNHTFYSNLRKEVFLKCAKILQTNNSFKIQSKIENIAIWALKFSFEDKEALIILKNINRNNKYNFYRIIQGDNFLPLDYNECYREYIKNKNNIETIKFPIRKIFETQNEKFEFKQEIIDKRNLIIKDISSSFKSINEIIKLLNTLDLDYHSSENILEEIFISWLKDNSPFFIDMAKNHLNKIENIIIQNIIKKALYQEGFATINIDDITIETTKEEILIYINSLFKHNNHMIILYKIIEVSQNKNRDYLSWLISTISKSTFFKIKTFEIYKEFEPIIIQFLNWQLEYNLFHSHNSIIYLLHNRKDMISNEVKNILKKVVRRININMDEFQLKNIYEILDYGLKEITIILYQKLIFKKEDGTYHYHFTHYFSHYLYEDSLIKFYINSYSDFRFLVDEALRYCTTPIEIKKDENGKKHEFKIHLDYFLHNAIKEEYIRLLFSELIKNNDIKTIQILYIIVPISTTYLDIIVQNLNLLDEKVSDEELMDYLQQIGKAKIYSRSYMQNSDLLSSEKTLFRKICNGVHSLSLQLKLKEELKYFEIRKREEIEEDIARLLDR